MRIPLFLQLCSPLGAKHERQMRNPAGQLPFTTPLWEQYSWCRRYKARVSRAQILTLLLEPSAASAWILIFYPRKQELEMLVPQ